MQASMHIAPEFRFINDGSDAMNVPEEDVDERDEKVVRRINVVVEGLSFGRRKLPL